MNTSIADSWHGPGTSSAGEWRDCGWSPMHASSPPDVYPCCKSDSRERTCPSSSVLPAQPLQCQASPQPGCICPQQYTQNPYVYSNTFPQSFNVTIVTAISVFPEPSQMNPSSFLSKSHNSIFYCSMQQKCFLTYLWQYLN